MISIIGRKRVNSEEYNLSLRVNSAHLKNAVALGVGVSEARCKYICSVIKNAKKAYKKKASIFIEDPLAQKLWEIVKLCMIKDHDGTLTPIYIYSIARQILFKEEVSSDVNTPVVIERRRKAKPTLLEYFEVYLDELKSGKRTKIGSSDKLAYKSYYTVVATYKSLIRFSQKSHAIYDWDDMTADWAMNYKQFLKNEGKSANTIALYFTQLKAFLRASKLLKYTTTDDFNTKLFSSSHVEVNTIALTEEEIKKIYSLKITTKMSLKRLEKDKNVTPEELEDIKANRIDTPRHCKWLETTRDAFVMACLIGQRFSDFKRIENDMLVQLEGKTFIHITQTKTKKDIYIPCSPLALTIINKYRKFPRFYNDVFNDRLKIVCLLAGLTSIPKMGSREGMIDKNSTKRICDLVSTHTARRSFATNAYKNGIPLSSIMAVTGHSTEAMLRKYLKLDTQERAIKAAKDFEKLSDFFK